MENVLFVIVSKFNIGFVWGLGVRKNQSSFQLLQILVESILQPKFVLGIKLINMGKYALQKFIVWSEDTVFK